MTNGQPSHREGTSPFRRTTPISYNPSLATFVSIIVLQYKQHSPKFTSASALAKGRKRRGRLF